MNEQTYRLTRSRRSWRARTLRPGPRELARISTRQLLDETRRRVGEYDGRLPARDRTHLCEEYARRDLHSMRSVLDTATGAVMGAAVTTEVAKIVADEEAMATAEAAAIPTPLTYEDRLADAQDLGIDPDLVAARAHLEPIEKAIPNGAVQHESTIDSANYEALEMEQENIDQMSI